MSIEFTLLKDLLMKKKFSDHVFAVSGTVATIFVSNIAAAQSMPWDSTLSKLQAALSGPTARTILILAIVSAGLAFAIGESGSFFRRCAAAVFGGAIAIGASSMVSTLFPG